MNETDIKLIEIFGKKELALIWDNWKMIAKEVDIEFTKIWHIPHLEDIFRVASKEYMCDMISIFWKKKEKLSHEIELYGKDSKKLESIPYNPTLQPLDQTEETKEALIDLFSN